MDTLELMKHFNLIEQELVTIKKELLKSGRNNNRFNSSKFKNNSKKVTLFMENGEKKTFNSISSCAKFIDIPRTTLRDNLNKKGFYYSYKGKVVFGSGKVMLP